MSKEVKKAKEETKITIRSDFTGEIADQLLEIKAWLGTGYTSEALRFCISQTYRLFKAKEFKYDEKQK